MEDQLFEVALQTRDFRYTGVTQARNGGVIATAVRLDRHIAQHLGHNEQQAKRLLARLITRQ